MEQPTPPETSSIGKISDEPVELVSRIGKTTNRPASNPVFVVDDTFFRSRTPKSTHWSVAWSDLMMTMFILFLTLFVYQLAHREFLSEETPEVVAGTTMPLPAPPLPALPFHPISPTVSNTQALQVKKAVPTPIPPKKSEKQTNSEEKIAEQDIDAIFAGKNIEEKKTTGETARKEKKAEAKKDGHQSLEQELSPAIVDTGKAQPGSSTSSPQEKTLPKQQNIDQGVQKSPADGGRAETIITRMYDLSKITVADEKLEKFASVELIPDKTMRIVLTGDLLFPSGRAELTREAKISLRKLIPIIRRTPYMINVIGHTDSMPMHSARFSSNWELSTARAGRVARFLIEQGHIPASHFVVTGYSYYRPVKPNTTAANRRANRRVEIIISKEPPPAQAATQQNIK